MAVPYKEWEIVIKSATVEGLDPTTSGPSWDEKDEWTIKHFNTCLLGQYKFDASYGYWWKGLIKPVASDFELVSGLDCPVDYGIDYQLAKVILEGVKTKATLFLRLFARTEVIDFNLVTGQLYDGLNDWNQYPCPMPEEEFRTYTPIVFADHDTPVEYSSWIASNKAPNTMNGWLKRALFFRNGVIIRLVNYQENGSVESIAIGDHIKFIATPQKVRARFHNPIVNSLSTYHAPTAGGIELIFSGLGFNNPNSELSDTNLHPDNTPPTAGWDDEVDFIHFEGLQGQTPVALSRGADDFIINNNSQITIPSTKFPALAKGTYYIRLQKINIGSLGWDINPEGYAGDWRCYEDGRVYSGERFTFLVTDEEVPEKPRDPRTPIPTIKQRLKDFEGNIDHFRYFAPIDTRGAENFWDGRIKNLSGLTRGVNDQTGLFLSSDISIDYANTDNYFSKLLAEYRLANEPLEMFLAWKDYPESYKTAVFKAFIENIKRKGSLFTTECRDLSSVYFKKEFPMHRINEDDFPNCDENFLTKPKPEALGLLYHDTIEAAGAMEAAYIDTVNHIYLAARGLLKEITEVYSDGEKKTVIADYNVSYSAEGETLITFLVDQEASKITFNCKGYIYNGWNSINGFIQHPVYVFLYILAFVFEIPFDLIDLDSFETVKEILDNIDPDIGTKGFWGEMAEKSAENIMQEHLITIGAVIFPDKYGRLTLSKKDISNISTTKIIFAQIDTSEPPLDDWGYKEAVNKIKLNWDYVPAAGIFKHSKSELRDDAVEAMSGNIIEEPLDLKWTTSTLLVMKRLQDEFYKRGKGYKKISFSVSMSFIEELDVHDSFRLQDPFGTSKTGGGVFGRYCFVEKIDYEFQDMKMNIEALDLSYIMRQYLVLGDETALEDNWSSATDEQKAFAYLGHEDTGKFANGEAAKILIDEVLVL